MPGYKPPAQFSGDQIRKNTLNLQQNWFYVGVFDTAPLDAKKAGGGFHAFHSDMNDDAYWTQFMADMEQLMEEFKDLAILYKPKRDFLKPNSRFQKPSFLNLLLERQKENPRWVIMDSEINPWIPVMASDLVVGMPFSSTCFAALNKHRAFLFHDSQNKLRHTFYEDLHSYVSHSTEELIQKVKDIRKGTLNYESLRDTAYYVPLATDRRFAQNFTEFLRNVAPKKANLMRN